MGPTDRDEVIVSDFAGWAGGDSAGWTAEQDRGKYRLKKRNDSALIGHVVGPHS